MSRNGSGTYTLPAGNPVVTGTTIESTWANTTLSDIATTLTDSLSRSGQGGMTAALRIADGTQSAPGVAFANETGSGFYRAGTGEVWAVVQGAQTLNLDANGVYVPADKTTTVDGAFAANGNSTLGDAVGDAVTVNGTTTFVNAAPTLTPLTASRAVFTNASKTLVSNAITGTGDVVMSASPTLVTPNIGTPTSGTLTNCTGLPIVAGTTGTLSVARGGTGVTSSTGTGNVVLSDSPILTGTPSTNRLFSVGLSSTSNDIRIDVGRTRTIDGNAYIDFFSAAGASTYNARLLREPGANGDYLLWQFGTGNLEIATLESAAITFRTNAAERARITSGGDLLVGDANGGLQNSYSTNFTKASGYWTVNHANGSPDTRRYFYFGYNGSEIGSITQDGTTAVLYNTTSDRRLKDNIVPAPSASAVIDAIEIVSHDWKAAPDEHVTYGVIAQDLALVAPQAVLQGDDGEEVEKPWGVDYSKLVPMLIKEIQTLRARVAALEAK